MIVILSPEPEANGLRGQRLERARISIISPRAIIELTLGPVQKGKERRGRRLCNGDERTDGTAVQGADFDNTDASSLGPPNVKQS
jgi:hypothetical protein